MDRLIRALNAVTDTDVTGFDLNLPLSSINGWDSMRAVNFQMELEQEFGVDLSNEEITGTSTLNDVIAMLRSQNADV
jgi:acyl carrier protein